MHKTRLHVLYTLTLLALLTGTRLTTFAQLPGNDTCPAGVREAFAQLDAVCSTLQRNEACYVSNNIIAAFYEDVDENTFSAPSDTVSLEQIRQLTTSPYDPETGAWGVAVMRVQANLPNTLPGQGVVFVMVGDVSLENAVAPNEAVALTDAIPATASSRVNARSGPGTTFNVVKVVEAGEAIGIDARNEAGDWLRGVLNDSIVWVFAGGVAFPGDAAALPIVGAGSYGAMQAFTMSTGIGNAECEDAPNSLLVQAPRQIEVTLNVNGLDVTVGSTVVFDTPGNENLRVSVLDGSATMPTGVIVPAGASMQGPLDENGMIEDVDDFEIVERMGEEQWEAFDEWDDIESEVLNYELEFDEEEFFDAYDGYTDAYDEYSDDDLYDDDSYDGYDDSYDGYDDGYDGYDDSYDGYDDSYDGYDDGYDGYDDGYTDGYDDSYDGYDDGYADGYDDSYDGYDDGYDGYDGGDYDGGGGDYDDGGDDYDDGGGDDDY